MSFLRQASLKLRLVKLRRFLGSFFYPIKRDWLEQKFYRRNLEAIETTGDVEKTEPTKRGGYFYFKHVQLEVCFLTPDLVRVEWKPGKPPIPYGISRQDWDKVEITWKEEQDSWVLSSIAVSHRRFFVNVRMVR